MSVPLWGVLPQLHDLKVFHKFYSVRKDEKEESKTGIKNKLKYDLRILESLKEESTSKKQLGICLYIWKVNELSNEPHFHKWLKYFIKCI